MSTIDRIRTLAATALIVLTAAACSPSVAEPLTPVTEESALTAAQEWGVEEMSTETITFPRTQVREDGTVDVLAHVLSQDKWVQVTVAPARSGPEVVEVDDYAYPEG